MLRFFDGPRLANGRDLKVLIPLLSDDKETSFSGVGMVFEIRKTSAIDEIRGRRKRVYAGSGLDLRLLNVILMY